MRRRRQNAWRARGEREQLGVGRRFGQRLGDLATRQVGRRAPRGRPLRSVGRMEARTWQERLMRASEGPVGRIITAAILLEVAWLLLSGLA